jgi:hypothetical protein
MRKVAVIVLILVLTDLACRDGSEGYDHYRAGRFTEAHAEFVARCEAEGEDASAELMFNRALAAIGAGDLSDAESSAEQAAAAGGEKLSARAEFLRGNAAFARCELAERQAASVEAEPFAFEIAIRFGEKARDLWMSAAMSRPDWPEARRNVERAEAMLESLRGRKREAESKKDPRPKPQPKPLPDPGQTRPEVKPNPEAKITELSPSEILALYERLAKKEREKRTVREAYRKERMTTVERDW